MQPGDRPISVGIIGLSADGGWASLAHVPALRAMPEHFRIGGLCASTPPRAEAAARAHEVPFWTHNPAELARHPDVDLVAVTVKVPHHAQLVQSALAVGKAVYCEWPLARDTGEAAAMAAAAASAGSRPFVGLQGRAAPALVHLRELLAGGFVGEPVSTCVVGAGGFPWGGMATKSMAYALDRATGATMLTIPFGHMIDTFTWILGGFEALNATLLTRFEQTRLLDADGEAAATGPDQIAVNGRLESGAVASLHYYGGDAPGAGFRWEIIGTLGSLVVEGATGHLQYGHVSVKGRRGDAPLQDLAVPADHHRVGIDPESYGHAVAHAYRKVHDDLTTGTRTAPTFADAIATHELLDRIGRASIRLEERSSQ